MCNHEKSNGARPRRIVKATRLIGGEDSDESSDEGHDKKRKGKPGPPPAWKRPSKKCVLCVHTGGVMSPFSSNSSEFLHEMCRAFCLEKRRAAHPDAEICALCGSVEGAGSGAAADDLFVRRMVRCAHKDCMVTFHPMCAMVGSPLMRKKLEEELDRARRR